MPLLQSMARRGRLDARHLSGATVAFLERYKGHEDDAMRALKERVRAGHGRLETGVNDETLHSLVKVRWLQRALLALLSGCLRAQK
jgi:hypothetical protein